MPFEPLTEKLTDQLGRDVDDPVLAVVVRAFERALLVPDADIECLIRGAVRVARLLADGRAEKPDEFAAAVLLRIAHQSRRKFLGRRSDGDGDLEWVEARRDSASAILATVEIEQMFETLRPRDQQIVVMRHHGYRYDQIAAELGMLQVTVRYRYHVSRNRLRELGGG